MEEIKGLTNLLHSKELELHKRKTGEDFHVAANNELNLKIQKLSNEMNLHKSALEKAKRFELDAHKNVQKLKDDIETYKSEILSMQRQHTTKEKERSAAITIQKFYRKRAGLAGGLGSIILEMGKQLKFAREAATRASRELEIAKVEHVQSSDELHERIQTLQQHLEDTEKETVQHLREKFFHEEENERLKNYIEQLEMALSEAKTPSINENGVEKEKDQEFSEVERELNELRTELAQIKNTEVHKQKMASILSNVSHLGEALVVSIAGTEREDTTSTTFFVVNVEMPHKSWNARRRYRQFAALSEALSSRLNDQTLPSLPQRSFFALTGPALEERRLALETWIKAVITIPAVWKYIEIISFLDSDEDHYLEKMIAAKNDTTPA